MASTTQVSSAEPYTAFTAAAVQQPAQVLYERGNIKVTDSGLELKCYYFPTGQKKFVQWRDVTDLESKKVNLGNCKTWGMALDFKVWWHFDRCVRECNKKRSRGIVLSSTSKSGSKSMVGMTPMTDDFEVVWNLCKEHAPHATVKADV
eukprot:CAMPEP_0184290226 /NCGR_PEP_ID=MMETSP1049-20130417/2559_1 /TAXON_ID=77928 /ORGANISM="Proteomonas sulcata, Strain CCMP704" /LENGTH=147 /DNA_ID=CAMNT_0026597345 /DNA_START=420 /DNA_END=863 /DNA_ORIENTATION=+